MTRALRTSIDGGTRNRQIGAHGTAGSGRREGISGGKVTAFFNWADCRCPDCTLGNLMVGVSEGVGVGVTGPLPPAFWGEAFFLGQQSVK